MGGPKGKDARGNCHLLVPTPSPYLCAVRELLGEQGALPTRSMWGTEVAGGETPRRIIQQKHEIRVRGDQGNISSGESLETFGGSRVSFIGGVKPILRNINRKCDPRRPEGLGM